MSDKDNFFESEEYLDDPIDDERYLAHYGTPRHSGRYPWGSGKNPQRGKDINARATELTKKGYTEREVASIMGYKSVSELRAAKSIGAAARDAAEIGYLQKLYDSGMGYSAIGKKVGLPESSVRSKLNRKKTHAQQVMDITTNALKDFVDKSGEYLDIGKGSELYLNVSKDRLKTCTEILKKQGYEVLNIKQDQLGTGNQTTMTVLAPKGTKWAEVMNNKGKIHAIQELGMHVTDDANGVAQPDKTHDPVIVDKSRVFVRYLEDAGDQRDGTIEIRRGVDDLNLGKSRYAQVRIRVGDEAHDDGYMKGMAFYSDDVPDGYDMIYNSNRPRGTQLFKDEKGDSVFKKMDPTKSDKKIDQFGALIDRQSDWEDEKGVKHEGALNIIRDEGDWTDWSRTVASQMLAKQRPEVAKQQLNIDIADRNSEFEEIMSLTNPIVKKRLLLPFSDECDSAAIHLKAAAFPRQSWNVILPFPDIKDDEIYAPNYKDGEKVVLIRYPHGGIFEMPELTVNNSYKSARSAISENAKDAVGINKKIADQLSGADFDGDTVLIIPNNDGKIKHGSPLKQLEGFDTKQAYPPVEGIPKVGEPGNAFDDQKQMGIVSNLIMDMTLGGATEEELARAVKHSMVVIDAKKHNLNWRQSEIDANLQELKNKYQQKEDPTKPGGGASTLITRAASEQRIPDRKRALTVKDKDGNYIVKEGIDVKTGAKVYEETGATTKYKNKDGTYKEEPKINTITKMETVSDARELISKKNTRMENIYADYANRCMALGNKARKAYLEIEEPKADPEMAKKYKPEVDSLKNKLRIAQMNAPLERLAQVRGGEMIKAMRRSGDHKYDQYSKADWKKEKAKALERARRDVGAKKAQIKPTAEEWEAIQNRAISPSLLKEILNNADLDEIKKLAMPKKSMEFSKATISRIKAYAAAGRTQAEIADALGISTTTVSKVLE